MHVNIEYDCDSCVVREYRVTVTGDGDSDRVWELSDTEMEVFALQVLIDPRSRCNSVEGADVDGTRQ